MTEEQNRLRAASDSMAAKDAIIDTAQDWRADLIVVGSHGRRGLSRFLLGSVSQAVVAHAPCSVAVIRRLHADKFSA